MLTELDTLPRLIADAARGDESDAVPDYLPADP